MKGADRMSVPADDGGMKMEHTISATREGVAKEFRGESGDPAFDRADLVDFEGVE
jgi:acetyl/propionyl-CoA carboxylase alpha subunit